MDPSIVTALAAVGGSVVGGMATIVAAQLAQRVQGRRERLMREQDLRERGYVEFIQKATDCYVESLTHSLGDQSALTELYFLIARIRLFSTPEVVTASEAVGAQLIEFYNRPPIGKEAAYTHHEEMIAPLEAFSDSCRVERKAILRRL